ncbi:hypothetical protein FRX31_010874 [Thalictrum thalictroides]|uniref:Uncharacterized protein n=1 Tax=Thalictrum thalictroides TaxID=46969 RepID=A0A7J6WQ93_THATH|nr:hypothetical protein FRX31_010874 [Thalictrum thalictroides]
MKDSDTDKFPGFHGYDVPRDEILLRGPSILSRLQRQAPTPLHLKPPPIPIVSECVLHTTAHVVGNKMEYSSLPSASPSTSFIART